MFAVLNIYNNSNAGCQLAFSVQAFFMPGHIVYPIWYPCTPVWSVNAPTAFELNVLSSGKGTDTFILKTNCLCLTNQLTLILQCLAASERPPTKRVLLLSPSPAIPTLTSLPMASTFMDALSVTCGNPIRRGTTSLGDSISPDVKKQPELLLMKPLFFSWCGRIVNIAVIRQNAVSRNGNGTCLRSSAVIRMPWYFRHTFPDLHLSHQLYALFPVAAPSGIIAFSHSDLRTNSALHINRYTLVPYHSIPRTPWNKKESKVGEVLKRKLFRNTVQQSNRPTRKNILKCNFL